MPKARFYNKPVRFFQLTFWDCFALAFLLIVLAALAWASRQMSVPFHLGDQVPISLSVEKLPGYALQSVLRMFVAMLVSFLFTFSVGALAAKNKHAERFIIPIIDILQSVPVLGFLSITITGFIMLFPNSLLGPECACIFVIFTAQAWNMALGFYQSLKNVPVDLQEAAAMFHLSSWQKFWRIEVPLATPSLLWNTMMSMSASWVFLVASEAISVSNQSITLPGIGSYISLAIDKADIQAIAYAIIAMLLVILLYDQLLFRPLVVWSDKFRFEQNPYETLHQSWFAALLQKSLLVRYTKKALSKLGNVLLNTRLFNYRSLPNHFHNPIVNQSLVFLYYSLLTGIIILSLIFLGHFIFSALPVGEVWETFKMGWVTLMKVLISILVSSLIWIPLGVWVGQRPTYARLVQPVIQFLAGFPANILSSLVAIAVLAWHLNPTIWLTSLMIVGAQWYIAFNVIAGTTTLPKEFYDVTRNLGVRGWLRWKRLILPGIFPYFVTGALTAAGASWNLSIVVEVVKWGEEVLKTYGLGAYISTYTDSGDFHRIALSITMMSLFVVGFNRLVWQPLYELAHRKYGL